MPVTALPSAPDVNRATLVALRALVAGSEELHRIWCTQRPHRALTETCPEWLPDFDEFVSDLIAWRDAFARVVGYPEGEGPLPENPASLAEAPTPATTDELVQAECFVCRCTRTQERTRDRSTGKTYLCCLTCDTAREEDA